MKLIAAIVLTLFIPDRCRKGKVTNVASAKVAMNRSVDTLLSLDAKLWDCYSFKTLDLVDQNSSTYFTAKEGLFFRGQDHRLGSRVQTKSIIEFQDKTVYFKWKGLGMGMFTAYAPQIKYDAHSSDSTPAIKGVDLGVYSASGVVPGSIPIEEDVWYYTRLVPTAGSDMFKVIIATNGYDNDGGTIISNAEMPIYQKDSYIAIRMGDCFVGTYAFGILGEYRIASK